MRCVSCGQESPEDSTFCDECGSRLERACPSCGAPAGSAAKFCRSCGSPLHKDDRAPAAFTPAHLAEKILASRTALEGERKQVTALFADLRGSMDLLEEFDPEEARRLMDPAVQMMMDAVHRFEGTVNHVLGDRARTHRNCQYDANLHLDPNRLRNHPVPAVRQRPLRQRRQ